MIFLLIFPLHISDTRRIRGGILIFPYYPTVIFSWGNFDVCIVAIGGDFQSSLETTAYLKDLGAKLVVAEKLCDKVAIIKGGQLIRSSTWVEKNMALPPSQTWCIISFNKWAAFGSSPTNGSSIMISLG